MANGAKGFVVRTSSATITDLGTEFGVAYDSQKDVTEVDVFKGGGWRRQVHRNSTSRRP